MYNIQIVLMYKLKATLSSEFSAPFTGDLNRDYHELRNFAYLWFDISFFTTHFMSSFLDFYIYLSFYGSIYGWICTNHSDINKSLISSGTFHTLFMSLNHIFLLSLVGALPVGKGCNGGWNRHIIRQEYINFK